jgi:hypothetical protein
MRPFSTNAFIRDGAGRASAPPASLAGLLAPMRATLLDSEHGVRLELEPMRAADAASVWSSLSSRPDATTIVFAAANEEKPAGSRGVIASGEATDAPRAFAVEAGQLAAIAARSGLAGVTAVLVEGPVEPADIEAMGAALAAGGSPLGVEVRAIATMRVVNDRAVFLEARDRSAALRFVAENFRHYLAALRRRPVSSFSLPDRGLIDRLMSLTGGLTVRPIETEVYSTAIDIGVSIDASGPARPAGESLIYDIHGNAWYGE